MSRKHLSPRPTWDEWRMYKCCHLVADNTVYPQGRMMGADILKYLLMWPDGVRGEWY